MKRKILSIVLSCTMVFSTTGFAFADTEVDNSTTESTKVEKKVEQEQPKEEVKQEESTQEQATQQETEPTTEQIQKVEIVKKEVVKKETNKSIKITLNFADIRHADGSVTNESTSNNISYGGSWGFTKTKFERTTGLRTGDPVTYNGRDYTYSGKWICNINPDTPINADETFRLWNKEGTTSGNTYYLNEDTTLTFTPIYIPKTIYTLTANYIDEIGNGSGGESHEDNGGIGYKHTFEVPADVPKNEYEFIYWDNETDGETYGAGDAYVLAAGELQDNKTVNIYATYKPIVTVNYHDEKGTLLGSVTGKVVNIYENGEVFKKSGKFLGWYTNDELIPSDEVKDLPLTRIKVQTTFDVYAKYKVVPKPDPIPNPPHKPDSTTPKVEKTTTEFYYGMGDGKEYTPITATKTPFTAPKEIGAWALINLLTVIVNFAICILLFLMVFINNKKEDDEIKVKNKMPLRIDTAIIAIISAIIFFLTENMSLPMVWVDKWTLPMIILLIIQIILMILCKHKVIEEEEIEE